jgi:hypothetical protein
MEEMDAVRKIKDYPSPKKTILSPDKQKNRAESIERFSRLQITPTTLLPVKEISTIFSFIFQHLPLSILHFLCR